MPLLLINNYPFNNGQFAKEPDRIYFAESTLVAAEEVSGTITLDLLDPDYRLWAKIGFDSSHHARSLGEALIRIADESEEANHDA